MPRDEQEKPRGSKPSVGNHEQPEETSYRGESHLSFKYTKEEILARHWGLTVAQTGRVKALLRMGVSEEDLIVAERLLKLGRYGDYQELTF